MFNHVKEKKSQPRIRRPIFLAILNSWLLIAMCVMNFAAAAAKNVEKNQIYTLGSLHSQMLTHRHYTLPVFIQAMELFHPDLILAEVRSDHPGSDEGCIDGGIEQGIVAAYGTAHSIPVIAVDWFDDDYSKRMEASDSKSQPKIEKKIRQIEGRYSKIFEKGTFLEIQDKSTQDVVEQMYAIEEQNGEMLSRERNEHICKQIDDALAGKHGLRVLIVFGLDHKYFFERYLSNKENDKVLSIKDWYMPSDAPKVSAEIKELSIKNIRSSQKLLGERLKSDYYEGGYKVKLTNKAAYFDRWIAKLQAI